MQNFLTQVNSFLDEYITHESWYKNITDDLKAIVLYGSVAKGTNRADSDIDLFFILPLEVEEKFTEGEYFVNYKGQEFNIVMRSIEGLRSIASGEYDPFQAEIFRESKTIWQKDTEVQDLITKIISKSNIN